MPDTKINQFLRSGSPAMKWKPHTPQNFSEEVKMRSRSPALVSWDLASAKAALSALRPDTAGSAMQDPEEMTQGGGLVIDTKERVRDERETREMEEYLASFDEEDEKSIRMKTYLKKKSKDRDSSYGERLYIKGLLNFKFRKFRNRYYTMLLQKNPVFSLEYDGEYEREFRQLRNYTNRLLKDPTLVLAMRVELIRMDPPVQVIPQGALSEFGLIMEKVKAFVTMPVFDFLFEILRILMAQGTLNKAMGVMALFRFINKKNKIYSLLADLYESIVMCEDELGRKEVKLSITELVEVFSREVIQPIKSTARIAMCNMSAFTPSYRKCLARHDYAGAVVVLEKLYPNLMTVEEKTNMMYLMNYLKSDRSKPFGAKEALEYLPDMIMRGEVHVNFLNGTYSDRQGNPPYDPKAHVMSLSEELGVDFSLREHVRPQADFATFESFQGIKISNTFVVKKLAEVWTIFLGSHLFHNLSDGYKIMLDGLKFHTGSLTSDFEFFTGFYDFCIGVFRNIMKFKDTLNPMDLFGAPRDLAVMQEIAKLKSDIKAMQMGKQTLDFPATRERAKRIRGECAVLINTGKYVTLNSDFAWLRQCIDQLEAMVTNSRIQPYTLSIRGPPGCGKTKIVESMASIVAYHSGATEPTPNNVLTYESGAKFQKFSGYPQVVLLNDFGSIKEEFVEQAYVALLQQLVDEAPFVVPRASLAEKEESVLYHNLVVVTTNERTTLSTKATSVQKLDRRFNLVVEVEYSELCKELAEEEQISVEDYFREHASDDNLIRITTGTMKCGPTTINWRPQHSADSQTFTNWVAFEMYFAVEYRKYTDAARRRKNSYEDLKRCSFGVSLPHDPAMVCPCQYQPLPQGAWEVVRERIVYTAGLGVMRTCTHAISRVVSYNWDLWITLMSLSLNVSIVPFIPMLGYFLSAFDGIYMNFTVSTPRLLCLLFLVLVCNGWLFTVTMLGMLFYMFPCLRMNALARVYHVNDEVRTKWWRPIFKRNVMPVIGAMCTLIAGYTITKYLMRPTVEPHGNIHGHPLNIPEDRLPVVKTSRVVLKHPSHWSPGDARIVIKREGCEPINATIASPQMIIVPRHYFFKHRNNTFPTKPLLTNEVVEGWHSGKRFTFVMSPKFYSDIGDDVDALVVGVFLSTIMSSLKWPSDDKDDKSGYYWDNKLVDYYPFSNGMYNIGYTGVDTKAGECGTPIYSRKGEFVGIHAGIIEGRCSLGSRITQEAFLKACDKIKFGAKPFSEPTPDFSTVNLPVLQQGCAPKGDMAWMDDAFPVIGHRNMQGHVTMTGRATELLEVFKDDLKEEYGVPDIGHAKRSPTTGEYVSIITNRLDAMQQGGCIDFEILNMAADLMPITQSLEAVGRITLHQALTGDPENVFISPRDDTKGIGADLRAMGLTAKNVVEQIGEDYRVHPLFLGELDRMSKLFLKGPIVHLVSGVIKDEVLPLRKVNEGGGRLFFVCSLAMNTHIKMAAGNVLTTLLTDTVTHEIFAAINAGSSAWKDLYDHITVNGTRLNVFDADENKYDCRHGAVKVGYRHFMHRQAVALNFSNEDLEYMDTVLMSSDYMVYNITETYVATRQGLPSGLGDTIHRNSVIKKLMFYYAVIKRCLVLGVSIPTTEWFQFQLRLAICGDDALFSQGSELTRMLPDDWFQSVALESGYVMTPGDKVGSVVRSMHISEVTFLKRKFRVVGERVFAPLDKKSIYKALCYMTKTSVSEKERNSNALLCAQREMFMHGEEELLLFQEKIREVNSLGYNVQLLDYSSMLASYDAKTFETW